MTTAVFPCDSSMWNGRFQQETRKRQPAAAWERQPAAFAPGSLGLNLMVSVPKSPLLFTFCLLAFPQLKPIPGACSSDASKNPKTRRTWVLQPTHQGSGPDSLLLGCYPMLTTGFSTSCSKLPLMLMRYRWHEHPSHTSLSKTSAMMDKVKMNKLF